MPEQHIAPPVQPAATYVAPPPPPPSTPVIEEPPARERGINPWAVMLLAAAGIIALLAVLYLYVLPSKKPVAATPAAPDPQQQATPSTAAAAPKAPHRYAKFLEITGLRVNEDSRQRAQVQFIVVNHSAADLPEMKMQITVQSAGKSLFDFPYKLPSLGPYETKEGSATLKTDLKPYEMPDWQFLKASFDITSEPE